MADIKLNETFQQIKQLVIEMPLIKKASILTVVAVSIASLIFLGQLSTQSRYQVLFSNLESEDIASITEALDKYKISYRIQSESKAIMVPSDEVLQARLKLAKEGLPQSSGVGFEIFDAQSFGMTDFEQQLNYQRALQGELQRTINDFREIDDSRVHLVVPEKSVFLTAKEHASASIILKLKKGEKVREETVQSIVHMVSASVKDLDAQHVTVVDTNGQLLTSTAKDGQNGTLGGLRKKNDLEASYENKVRSLLEPIVGFGKIKVRVTADLDFTAKQTTEEKFDPDSIAIRTEARTRNKETDSQNSGGGETVSANSNSKEKDNQIENITYEVSKQVQQISHPVGELKNLSVAVIVDGVYKKNEEGAATYVARTEEEMKQFEDIIRSAIGYSKDRGDQLKVMNLAFQNPEEVFASLEKSPFEGWGTYTFYFNLIVNLIIAIIALLLIFFVIRPVISAWNQRRMEEVAPEPALAGIEQKLLTPSQAKDELEQKALSDPADMVQVLRKWLQ